MSGPDIPVGAETRLDAAWMRANAPKASDAETARFYDVMLAETLYLPVFDEIDEDTEQGIAPKMIEVEGVQTLLAFDTEERLARFIEGPSNYVALPGRGVIEMIAGRDVQLALNLGVAPSATLLPPGIIDWIWETISAPPDVVELGRGAPLSVSAPTQAPQSLLAALTARLALMSRDVAEAWLFTTSFERDEGGIARHLVLGLRLWPEAEPRADRLAQELAQLGNSFLPVELPFDIGFLNEGDRLLMLARERGLGLLG